MDIDVYLKYKNEIIHKVVVSVDDALINNVCMDGLKNRVNAVIDREVANNFDYVWTISKK